MAGPGGNIIFFTNSELGQCNVALAVAEEFLRGGDFCIHLASFRPLAPMVEELNKRAEAAHPAEFHEIWGPCMTDLAIRSNVGLLSHRPGVSGAVEGFTKVRMVMSNWKPSEYARAYRTCIAIIEKIRPGVVMVDPILHIGLDACEATKIQTVVLWPVGAFETFERCGALESAASQCSLEVSSVSFANDCGAKDHIY